MVLQSAYDLEVHNGLRPNGSTATCGRWKQLRIQQNGRRWCEDWCEKIVRKLAKG